jgi:inorganic pyrophosphatase
LPQTWEDPNIKHPDLGVMGDGDPVDVVEIGSSKHAQGAVKQIRALGALAMIDDGELDWKVSTIVLV